MTKCPNCKNEISKPNKTWKYGPFVVDAYLSNNCKTQFRDYSRNGKYNFTLQFKQGRYVKRHDEL
jgi:hypothetical protein